MADPERMTNTSSSLTVREERRRFFAVNEFGADGGYEDDWADAAFGPFHYRVPNIAARARALRIHDLHHLVTGYATDWRGEAQISAWELGSGWGRHPYAWIIALFGFFTGLLVQPLATFVAFVRGRSSRNLYRREDVGVLLDEPMTALRSALGVPAPATRTPARSGDFVLFASTATLSVLFGVLSAPAVLLLVLAGEMRRAAECMGCPFDATA